MQQEILHADNNNTITYNSLFRLLYVYRKNKLITVYQCNNKSMDEIINNSSYIFQQLKKLDLR